VIPEETHRLEFFLGKGKHLILLHVGLQRFPTHFEICDPCKNVNCEKKLSADTRT
jgi:hypothetical protein